VADTAAAERRRSSRRGWFLVLVALFAIPVLLITALWGYGNWANTVPPFRPSLSPQPLPNGYERAAELCARLPAPPAATLPRWPEGPTDQLSAALQPVRPILNDVRTTFDLQWRAPPLLSSNQVSPELSSFRECARCFVAEAAVARSQGHRGLALQRNLDTMELAARIPRGGVMIHGLVSAAVHAIGMAGAERAGLDLPLSDIAAAQARVRRIRAAWPPVGELLEGERLFGLSAITEMGQEYRRQTPVAAVRSAWDQLQGAGENDFSFLDEAISLWLTPKRRVMDNLDQYYRELIAESKKPVRQRKPVPLPDDPVSQLMGPSITSYEPIIWWRVHTSLALLETALAVQAYRQEHGRYPERLAVISRRWLPNTPLDAWGQPIRYRLQASEPQIYSLGPDAKDDGARPIEFRNLQATSTGDLVWGSLLPRRRPLAGAP
jgi:hypothetical protein